ncbi:hypothetical protein AFM12_01505 [Jiulongibacter sediminis]|uniref:Uncharacterized protein n=1 Tax=Jiulongibacter sediminis TaxID=1605367 RepID=A0A0P7C9T9_9BACT|nr:hypothetical protein AFM12_01505 [Jiulongibacter sediminis]TBX26378.1 hypothetical protein TK44_01510 [Jiulongibacter sediminis]
MAEIRDKDDYLTTEEKIVNFPCVKNLHISLQKLTWPWQYCEKWNILIDPINSFSILGGVRKCWRII